jgi:hypothetical protein
VHSTLNFAKTKKGCMMRKSNVKKSEFGKKKISLNKKEKKKIIVTQKKNRMNLK